MELTKLCRICLIKCENQLTFSIYSEETILKLNLCGGLSIVDNDNINLPAQMCAQCFQSLENAHNFRTTCQNSEKRLMELTKINTISEDSKEDLKNKLSNLPEHLMKCNLHQEIQNDLISESNVIKVESDQKDIKAKRKYTRKKSKEKQNLTVNDKLICNLCQVEYKAKNAYIYHMRRHRNEMDFVCEICGNAYETNFKLSRHLLQHTGIKKYPCRTCNKSFPTSSNRDRHERRLHTTIRPFQCEYCIKVFAYSDQLKNHIRVHTGEKPFICEKCGTGFRRKSHLITHNKAITPCFLKNKETNKQPVREIKQVL